MGAREDRFGGGDFRPAHRGPLSPWPEVGYDAVLHLLDRQIVDVRGLQVGKVDDVELTETPEGALVPTGLLVGAGALLPRLGDRLGQGLLAHYRRMRIAHADHGSPAAVDLELVEDVTSEVHLSVEREGLLRRRLPEPGDGGSRHRLGELLRMPVRGLPSEVRVLDARLDADPDGPGLHRVVALVIGPGRPGSLLGYERKEVAGPWLVRSVVRWLHRDTRLLWLDPSVVIDWSIGEVRVGEGARIVGLDRGTDSGEAQRRPQGHVPQEE